MATTAAVAQTVRAILTDGSAVYNVKQRIGDIIVTFACNDKKHADALTRQLNECAWIETNRL